MTPTNTQGSEQEQRAAIAAELDLFALHINQWKLYTPSAEMNGEINQRLDAILALIKSDREAHTKKIEAIVEHEYQHTTYSDMNLDSICNYDDAFEHGAEVLNKKISKRLAQLSKEDSSHT